MQSAWFWNKLNMSVYRQTLRKSKKKSYHKPFTCCDATGPLLEAPKSSYFCSCTCTPTLSPVPHTPNTLSPMEALVPSTSPLQEKPGCHHRHRSCSCSPLLKSPSFPSLKRWTRKLDELCQCEAGDGESIFCLVWRNLSALLFPWRGGSWGLLLMWLKPLSSHSGGRVMGWCESYHQPSLIQPAGCKAGNCPELSGNYLIDLEL